ncbi:MULTISPECIES: iron chelate uptake ABC transporter family permease subunit [unclassified Salinivibrio]|uniref:iron chelate uptake ABC transporter family permease subunit n=1 Tax=unclassified Salinivibrio TaxID=2636825 RepID=UPI00084C25F9|nr:MULTISPECIES: iron chelate uptake ABC transporter family permease subunit [unclassified Salinivibrio]ODQ01479.1 ABC transporter permease [Salinivibrio sp. DV]PCE65318.1 ABC transporter permease [Salinivibrio sp. YCSC6]
MRDVVKLSLVFLGTLAVAGYFLGHGLTADNYAYFLSRRTPKVLAIALAAVAISASSLVFQTITNNRILTPSILGFDSLYMLLQTTLLVVFGASSVLLINPYLNFVVCVILMTISATVLFTLYFRRRRANIYTLLLIGIVLGSVFGSISQFFTLLVDPSEFAVLQDAMFASFNNANRDLVYMCVPVLALCLLALYRYANQLDVCWLGEDNAISLGVDIRHLTLKVMMIIAVMIAVSTALVGPVLFFGLIVVSLARQMFISYQHRFLIIATSILAVFLLLTGQFVVEQWFGFETTVSVIINFVGGSYFLYLLTKNKF